MTIQELRDLGLHYAVNRGLSGDRFGLMAGVPARGNAENVGGLESDERKSPILFVCFLEGPSGGVLNHREGDP
jgi:hypothetical protein